jgi:membrane protein YqaA with SNARE-associated domain
MVSPIVDSVVFSLLSFEVVLWWFDSGVFNTIEEAVTNARGLIGLLIIAVYSFLIAFILPLPSEIVLAAPLELGGLPELVEGALIILVSGLAKAAGSVVALRVGTEASSPVIDRLKKHFDLVEVGEQRAVKIVQEYGYIGLALLLMIPFFPDTVSIYAFSVLDEDYPKFAAATFVGSVGRLLIFVGVLAPFFNLF